MKLGILPLLCTLALACIGPMARATLIGDTISVTHRYPSLPALHVDLGTTTVAAGATDAVTMGHTYGVNPEASSILVDFWITGWWHGPVAFNGLVVSGIDDTILGLTVSTNLVGWTDSRITFDAHAIYANWNNISINNTSFFNVYLQLAPTAIATPDAGATVTLLGLSLLGLFGLHRKLGATQMI